MKFKSSGTELKKALNILSPIINHNSPILAYRYILMREKGDKIEFKAFDECAVGSAFINCYNKEEDKYKCAYVLAKHFMGLVNSFGGSEVKISIEEDGCKISSGKSKYKLRILDEKVAQESIAGLDIDYYNETWTGSNIKVDMFSSCFMAINHCLSKDNAQRDLQNIYLSDDYMVACDGVRGAATKFPTKDITKNLEVSGIPLHKKACDCILNIGSGSEICLNIKDGKIFGNSGNFIFVSSLEEEYPYKDIKSIIDKFDINGDNIKIEFDPDEISDKLSRILMFVDSETNAVCMSFEEDKLILSVGNNNKAEETIMVFKNNSKDNWSIYVDGKSFKEAISKALSQAFWITPDKGGIQFLWDNNTLQFFAGLSQ